MDRTALLFTSSLCLFAVASIGDASAGLAAASGQPPIALPECGAIYAEPFGDAAPRRTCPRETARSYHRKHNGLGYDVLDKESDPCFVPDSAYELLDKIVDEVIARLSDSERTGVGISVAARAEAISTKTSQVLADMHFGLYIPTETLSDALVSRAAPGAASRYIEDCDTASMILLTVADNLHLSASLVEITLTSGSGHNFVRWALERGQTLDYDTNGRKVCRVTRAQLSFQGQAMSRSETMGYAALLRAPLWKLKGQYVHALDEYRFDIAARPGHPGSYNNFAWLFATNDFPGRSSYQSEALKDAIQAVGLQKAGGAPELTKHDVANYLDTLACVYAYQRNYSKAVATEDEALSVDSKDEFKQRRGLFASQHPTDCTGAV